ncbi:hypothetical protein TNCV_1762251 [Trichonephila clavipes]|nr:hypothetical protein TNCV_1762251 [Trichonephila clavipes]
MTVESFQNLEIFQIPFQCVQCSTSAYVFSSNNEEWEIFESNIKVPGKKKQINPKMPPKRKRSVRYHTHNVIKNMRRKRENEAPLKQELRKESNRLIMARLRALETVQK